jgi:hypothetical protein
MSAGRLARKEAECRILMRVNALTWRAGRNGPCKGHSALAWAKCFRDISHEMRAAKRQRALYRKIMRSANRILSAQRGSAVAGGAQ